MSGTLTLVYRATRLSEFLKQPNLWFVLGGQTPWADETLPPPPDPRWTEVPQPLAYKRADSVLPVFPHVNGPLFTPDGVYQPVEDHTPLALLQAKALQAFVGARLRSGDISGDPVVRIIGLTRGLQHQSGSRPILTPSEVQNPGLLLWVSTHRPFRLSQVEGADLQVVLHF